MEKEKKKAALHQNNELQWTASRSFSLFALG